MRSLFFKLRSLVHRQSLWGAVGPGSEDLVSKSRKAVPQLRSLVFKRRSPNLFFSGGHWASAKKSDLKIFWFFSATKSSLKRPFCLHENSFFLSCKGPPHAGPQRRSPNALFIFPPSGIFARPKNCKSRVARLRIFHYNSSQGSFGPTGGQHQT